jgi:hypothetical protein
MHVIHYPAVKALIVNESLYSDMKSMHQGNLQGTIGSIRTLATAFGSLFFTVMFSWGIEWGMPTIPFLVASLLYAIASILLLRYVVPTSAARTAANHATSTAPIPNAFEDLADLIIASPTSPSTLFVFPSSTSPNREYTHLPTTTLSTTTTTLSSPAPSYHPISYQVELLEQTILSDPISTLPLD